MMEAATIEEKFHYAVELIKNLPKSGSFQPSNDLKLKFYSYFKQATEGPCDLPKPSFWDLVNRAKWDAWNRLGEMPKQDAMKHYIDEFVEVLKTTPFDEDAHNFAHIMGPYIDFAPKEFQERHMHLNGNAIVDSVPTPLTEEILEQNIKSLKLHKGKFPEPNEQPKMGQVNGHSFNGTTESDSDQFSDTYDRVGDESENELVSSASFVRFGDSSVPSMVKGSIIEARGGGDQRVLSNDPSHPFPGSSTNRGNRNGRRGRSGDLPHHSQYPHNALGGGSGGKRNNNHPTQDSSADLSEQLAFAVIRLQYTMEQVVSRLDSLEILLQENRTNSCIGVSKMRNIFSSIFGVPPSAVLIIFVWPFIAQWLIYKIKKRLHR